MNRQSVENDNFYDKHTVPFTFQTLVLIRPFRRNLFSPISEIHSSPRESMAVRLTNSISANQIHLPMNFKISFLNVITEIRSDQFRLPLELQERFA